MKRFLSERNELELLKTVVDSRYMYTKDPWYKKVSKEIEEKLNPKPKEEEKWWRKN